MKKLFALVAIATLLLGFVIMDVTAIPKPKGETGTKDSIDVLDHYPDRELTSAEDYYEQGMLLLARRVHREAGVQFRRALELDPGHVYSMVGLVAVSLRLGDMESAVDFSRKAIKIQPDSAPLRNLMGERWMVNASFADREKAQAEAEGRFKEAISLDSKFVTARVNLANLYISMKKVDRAIGEYKAAIKIEPENPELRRELAYIYLNTGEIDKGLQEAEKMVELSPENPLYRNGLGEIYMNQGQLEKALGEFQQAITLEPKHAPAYMNMGKVHLAQGAPDKAMEEFSKALSHRPDYGEAYAGLGDAYLLKGMNREAAQEYEKAISENAIKTLSIQGFASVHNNLAYIYCEEGKDLDTALSHARKAIQVAPEHPGFADTLGWIYFRKGDYDEALKNLKAAAEAAPENPLIRYHLGAAYHRKGLREQAITELRKALSISERFPGVEDAKRTLAELESR